MNTQKKERKRHTWSSRTGSSGQLYATEGPCRKYVGASPSGHPLGFPHPAAAGSYNNIGSVYYHLGDYDQVLENCSKALAIQEKVLGTEHLATANSYSNIGFMYEQPRKYDTALAYFKKAEFVLEKNLAPDHPYIQKVRQHIADVKDKMGDN